MFVNTFLIAIAISTTNLTISEPVDGTAYNINDLLTVRAIVENENELPDSVHYSLNGEPVVQIPRLNTDWYTYMQNDLHHGFSESPAPIDNTILWTAPVTSNSHEFPTPVIVEGIVYYPSNSGSDSLYALDAATGVLIWKYWTGNTDDAVTIKDGYLYTASDSVWCLDALTGERIWATSAADASGSTPAVVNNRVYCGRADFSPNTSYIYCFDALTGAEIWSNTLSGYTASCMTVWNDMVFIPTYYYAQDTPLYALDANTGSIIWENTDSWQGYWDSSPVVVDSLIYINGHDGKARAINALTGTTTWAADIDIWDITATPAYHNGRLFFADQGDNYYCLDASAGGTVWTVPGFQHGSSGIADGLVFYGECFTDTARVVALNCETGQEVWNYETFGSPYGICSSPSITDGIVYIAASDWNLYAFGTGLKYTYLNDLTSAEVGWNELISTSFDGGAAVASDTINFYINATGIEFDPTRHLGLSSSPNPFVSTASISFELSEPGWTSITVYDLSGRIVRTLENLELGAGQHSYVWDGRNQGEEAVSAGLYFCRIQSGRISETTGLCLLR